MKKAFSILGTILLVLILAGAIIYLIAPHWVEGLVGISQPTATPVAITPEPNTLALETGRVEEPEVSITELGLASPAVSEQMAQVILTAIEDLPQKSEQQLTYEAELGRDLTMNDMVGFSSQGKMISNQFANRLVTPIFREDLFMGLSGKYNGTTKVQAAVMTENSYAWWLAYELMLNKNQQTLAADANAEAVQQNSLPWLAIHTNQCDRVDDEVRAYLELQDGVEPGTYAELPVLRYQTHWVTRIIEVTQEEYDVADSFQGWHIEAEDGFYRAKYGTNPTGDRFFVLEIFKDETKWAAIVVHSYEEPDNLFGFSLGGVRNNDLSIVLPFDPCAGNGVNPPSSQQIPTLVPTPEPTLKPTPEPKPSDPAQYVHPTGKPTAPPPAEPASTEPPSVTAAPVTAPPATAAPMPKPTAAPVAAPTPEVVVIDNPPAPAPYPAEPPSVEPGLSTEPNNEAIADPFGG